MFIKWSTTSTGSLKVQKKLLNQLTCQQQNNKNDKNNNIKNNNDYINNNNNMVPPVIHVLKQQQKIRADAKILPIYLQHTVCCINVFYPVGREHPAKAF
jgi:hypothetical protein